jgi:VWFA-related protein
MVTGRVEVSAVANDGNVQAVKWTVDDWSRVTPPPFTLSFDSGPVPYERRVLAVALDKDHRPLYRREAVLNPGGRSLTLQFHRPVDGQRAAGRVAVELQALAPADDEVDSVTLEAGGTAVPLFPAGSGLLEGVASLPPAAVALVARLSTRRGRQAEQTILVNAPGIVATADVHVVEQLVAVSKRGKPVEGLGSADFEVREQRGSCDVRDVRFMKDAPLAIGFAIDTSVSLTHAAELRRTTADVFVESCFTPKDSAFVLTFGPVVRIPLDWTRSKAKLRESILSLQDYPVPGTALFAAIQKAIYQFQGSHGARALILVTDGYDFQGEVPEKAALSYARESGVRVFVIGLTSTATDVSFVRRKGKEGEPDIVEPRTKTILQKPNEELLRRLAEACGGHAYSVTDPEDLPKIFRSIERDLRTQYLVSYVSSAPRRGTFHPVEVKSRTGKVRTAAGFFY